jgi:hypothetical protein
MKSQLLLLSAGLVSVAAFVPAQFRTTTQQRSALNLFDPSIVADVVSTASSTSQELAMQGELLWNTGSDLLTSFTDQGQNLAGIFFQASLLPYLLFLYFISFKANRIPDIANFGFQFLLLFVLSTIPSGIITKAVYGTSLANVDWLHGGAESLLTVANVLVVSIA